MKMILMNARHANVDSVRINTNIDVCIVAKYFALNARQEQLIVGQIRGRIKCALHAIPCLFFRANH